MIVNQTGVFRNWFDKIHDEIAKAAISRRIEAIEQYGNFGDAKPVGEGVRELRINYGPGYRLYYTVRGREVIILLCGGDKSSQQRDIEKAKKLNKEV